MKLFALTWRRQYTDVSRSSSPASPAIGPMEGQLRPPFLLETCGLSPDRGYTRAGKIGFKNEVYHRARSPSKEPRSEETTSAGQCSTLAWSPRGFQVWCLWNLPNTFRNLRNHGHLTAWSRHCLTDAGKVIAMSELYPCQQLPRSPMM